MQPRVRVRNREQVTAFAEVAHLRDDPPQLGDCAVVGVDGGVTRRESFERGARFEDLDRLDLGDASHPGAAVALALHEPVVLEPDECDPHGRASEPEPLTQLLLEQALTRQQLSAHDRLAKILITVGPDRQAHLSSARCTGPPPGRRVPVSTYD